MNSFALVSPQELAFPPDPRRRTCPFCYEREPRNAEHDFTDDWLCVRCGTSVTIHTNFEPCDSCGNRAPTRYYANRRKQFCNCHLSDEEQEEIAVREVENHRQDAIRQRKEVEASLELERQRKERELQQRKADRCWDDKGRKCAVKPAKLAFSFCSECVHLKPRTSIKPARCSQLTRLAHVETEEIDD